MLSVERFVQGVESLRNIKISIEKYKGDDSENYCQNTNKFTGSLTHSLSLNNSEEIQVNF